MRSLLPLPASHLHRRRVRLVDATLEEASLFPLFDGDGEVHALMMVWPASSVIALVEYDRELIEAPWWFGPIRLDLTRSVLRNADASHARAEAVAHLWHYDPWWVLEHRRFADHAAVPALKSTNAPGQFRQEVTELYYRRDLSRVGWVALDGKGDEMPARFMSELLPERPPPVGFRPAAARRGGWRLKAELARRLRVRSRWQPGRSRVF